MNIGSLHIVKKYFWILCPTKEKATASLTASAGASALRTAAWYSKRYKCEVTYFSPDSIVVFLEEDGELKRVLTSEGLIGWTWFNESYNDYFEEVKTEE